MQYHHNDDNKGLHRFSVQTFQFVNSPDPFVYIHCKVKDTFKAHLPLNIIPNTFSVEVKIKKKIPMTGFLVQRHSKF